MGGALPSELRGVPASAHDASNRTRACTLRFTVLTPIRARTRAFMPTRQLTGTPASFSFSRRSPSSKPVSSMRFWSVESITYTSASVDSK